jgi:hypothetical protein
MRNQIRNALTGLALARIDSLFPLLSAEKIMSALKESFGNSNIVVESAKSKLCDFKLAKPLTHASCVEITTYIASYMAACSYAGITITDSSISSRIHQQLEPYHQQLYYDFYFKKLPNAATRMERLDIQFEFLNSLSKTLPLGVFNKAEESKSKNKSSHYQVMTSSTKERTSDYSTTISNDNYKYEIKDKESARYIGYDMSEVNKIPRQCEICNEANHFSVECKTYRDMHLDAKYDVVKSTNLCRNCMLTSSHQARDCDVKTSCGFKLGKHIRCTARHHISLHRNNGTYNSTTKKSFNRHNEDKNSNSETESDDQTVETNQHEPEEVESSNNEEGSSSET